MRQDDTFFARWAGPCLVLAGIIAMLLIGCAIDSLFGVSIP